MSDGEKLTSWVRQAQSGDTKAFGHIVRHFQDMTVGYAASFLGDFQLAEDAAQEAFLEAWRDLPHLREPAAFAGWLRKIVFKHCDRVTRGKHLPTLPLEAAAELLAPEPDPAEVAEKRELREQVRQAIQSLPEGERMVTVLFYMSDYSQQEIAAFVGVALITVKKRLAAARKRLRERMMVLMQQDLHAQRPSRDENFANRVLAFTQQFSQLIDAGTPLPRLLTDLADRQDDERFREALTQIHQEVQEGYPLSQALSHHPDYFDDKNYDLSVSAHATFTGETIVVTIRERVDAPSG